MVCLFVSRVLLYHQLIIGQQRLFKILYLFLQRAVSNKGCRTWPSIISYVLKVKDFLIAKQPTGKGVILFAGAIEADSEWPFDRGALIVL